MCGIAGIIHKGNRREIDAHIMSDMLQSIRHRGPDDQGMEPITLANDAGGILGHVRLSIRDLSMAGHQPMVSDNGKVKLVFNGEIYNAEEIRPLLKEDWRGHSDTEVLLRCYETFGIDRTLELLNGAFAFCIVDETTSMVYLCRDRVGEKPLYYHVTDDAFLFASEMKAFYQYPGFQPELNRQRVKEFLLFNTVLAPNTLLKNVYLLEPGTYISWSANDTIAELGGHKTKYYTLPSQPDNATEVSVDALQNRLIKSIESRMVSDVEVAVQLSGGVDSSLTTWYSAQHNPGLRTYSVIFDDESLSERPYIDQVLDQSGCRCDYINGSHNSFVDSLHECTYSMEIPIHHQGAIQLYYLYERASEDIKVILSGEGADEVFGGYAWYPLSMFSDHLHADPDHDEQYQGQSWYSWAKAGYEGADLFLTFDNGISREEFSGMTLDPDISDIMEERRAIYDWCSGSSIDKKMNYEIRTFLQDLLLRQDKIGMAHSIECRVPYLDQDLIQYVRENVAYDRLVRQNNSFDRNANAHFTKIILKELAASIFGDEFAFRRKEGLHIPFVSYFYGDEETLVEDLLRSMSDRGIVHAEYIWECYRNRTHLNNVVWRALTLEMWCRIFIDCDDPRLMIGES